VSAPAATVRFGRLERRGVLLGLSGPQLAAVGAAAVIAVTAEYAAGLPGLLAAALLWAPLLAAGTASLRGRSVMVWLPIVGDWWLRRVLGATRQLHRVRQPHATTGGLRLELPGIRAPLPVATSPHGAALVTDRRAGTVSAVLAVRGRGVLLADDAAHTTAAWGRVLAGLTQARDVARVQVLVATTPAGECEVRRWWADHATNAGAPLPARLVADLLADADTATTRITSVLAVAFRRGGAHDDVQSLLDTFADTVTAAGLIVEGWIDPRRLCSQMRRAYDPTTRIPSDHAAVELGTDRFEVLGPMGVAESWAHLRTDTAVHATYWVAEWPRAEVGVEFLQPLLLAPGAHRAVSLIVEPETLRSAARDIRRARVDLVADSAHRARTGRIEDEAARAEADDVATRERDLVAGHGELRFTGLVTVTAADEAALAEACRATEAAAARAMCELRPLVGQQAAAHTAAALPLARGIL
jgi:hypothetical protein